MALLLYGSSEHGAHIWYNQDFRFVEGIWFDRVVKYDFLFGKDLFYFTRAQYVILYK